MVVDQMIEWPSLGYPCLLYEQSLGLDKLDNRFQLASFYKQYVYTPIDMIIKQAPHPRANVSS